MANVRAIVSRVTLLGVMSQPSRKHLKLISMSTKSSHASSNNSPPEKEQHKDG